MTRYLCVQCDRRFESEDSRPRCPKCMRVHGIKQVTTQATASRPRRRTVVMGLVCLIVAGGAAAFALSRGPASVAPGAEGAPTPSPDLEQELAQQGERAEAWADLFDPSPELTAWARSEGGEGDEQAVAHRLYKALRSGRVGDFAALSLVEPRPTPPMTAVQTFAAYAQRQEVALYPLEVSVMAAVALRSLGISALVAEAAELENDGRPLDPSGCLGYFLLAVPTAEGGHRFYDVYGGRPVPDAPSRVTPLLDSQVVAHALSTAALTRLAAQREPETALHEVQVALKLAPSAPVVRSVHAVALSSNGGINEGEDAARAALQLRADAPRYNQLATYLLQMGDAAGAAGAVDKALSLAPKFPSAFVTKASVLLLRGESSQALAALEQAYQLQPDLPGLDMAYVQYHAAIGELEVAIQKAESAIAKRAQEPQFYLALGRLYLSVGRVADMQSCARKVIELTPPSRQAKLEKVIAAVLGPEALSDEGGDPSVSATAPPP